MTQCVFDIFDIMACDVYWDYGTPGLPKEQHKFLVAPYAKEGKFTPDLVEEIVCTGPDGYKTEIANQKFTRENRNGHIYDSTNNNYWYMHNCPTGFMKEGEYTIEIRCKNGDVKKKSRYQKNAPSKTLVSTYLANRDKIFNSFSPSDTKKLPAGSAGKNIPVSWDPLKKLAGLDAYYIYRVAEGAKKEDWDVQNLAWWDNIFVERFSNKTAGLNKGEIVIKAELKQNSSYVYFVEITDSNAMGETNICIFQPFQVFKTL